MAKTVGRMYGNMRLKGRTSASVDTTLLTETNGALILSLAGKSGGTLTSFFVESSGQLGASLYGYDYTNTTLRRVAVDANGYQLVSYTPATSPTKKVVDAVAVPAAEADVWDPGGTSSDYYDIEIEIVNVDGTNAATALSVGVDVGDTGSTTYYLIYNTSIPAASVGTRIGPYRIGGDDVIRAVTTNALDAILVIYVVDEGTAS